MTKAPFCHLQAQRPTSQGGVVVPPGAPGGTPSKSDAPQGAAAAGEGKPTPPAPGERWVACRALHRVQLLVAWHGWVAPIWLALLVAEAPSLLPVMPCVEATLTSFSPSPATRPHD